MACLTDQEKAMAKLLKAAYAFWGHRQKGEVFRCGFATVAVTRPVPSIGRLVAFVYGRPLMQSILSKIVLLTYIIL
jgi:hypothetical protein